MKHSLARDVLSQYLLIKITTFPPILYLSSLFHFIGHVTRHVRSLVPQPETELVAPAVEGWCLNHWTTRKVPLLFSKSLAHLRLRCHI